MDELHFILTQAIDAARNRGADLASVTLAGGGGWVLRASQRIFSQAGLSDVTVRLTDPLGPVRLISYEVTRPRP